MSTASRCRAERQEGGWTLERSMRWCGRSVARWSRLGLALVLSACAWDVKDIDRTAPAKIEKKLLDGEWYFRPVVVHTQYNQGLVMQGNNGDLERVRWDIREGELIAYRSYELLEGAEKDVADTTFHGNPVAVFKIVSHFDVIRDYNPGTGAQSNVLVENTTDRPWYQRAYMRVDWSKNLLADPYNMMGEVTAMSAAPYYTQDNELDNPWRLDVAPDHINVVNNYVLVTDVNVCSDLFFDVAWCGPTQVKMLLSFLKVQKRDYDPLYFPDYAHVLDVKTGKPIMTDRHFNRCGVEPGVDWSECEKVGVPMFARFGYFRTERRTYDNEYQWTRDGRIFLANRWNIWARSHDGRGEVIPMAYRDTSKFTYYTNVEFPEDAPLWSATQSFADDWDKAYRKTVAELKRPLDRTITWEKVPRIYEVKRNDCTIAAARDYANAHKLTGALKEFGISEIKRGNLARACSVLEAKSGGGFKWQRTGDLRYSFLDWVDLPQTSGILGYGPSDADPVTGEIISATAHLYGAPLEADAAYAADLVLLMNGKLTLDEILKGENVRKQMASRRSKAFGDYSGAKLLALRNRLGSLADQYGTQWIPKAETARAVTNAKLARVQGTALERELLTSDELRRALLGPTLYQPGARDVPQVSPVEALGNDPWSRYEKRRIALGAKGVELQAWTDQGMVSIATELAGKSWDEAYSWFRQGMFRSLAAHEVGHTLGLRHNFSASFDPLNYPPGFWSYYKPELCRDGTTDCDLSQRGMVEKVQGSGEDAPHTRAERLMYSSIMDYHSRFYADSVEGLAPYDYAAIMFGYGQLVEVFQDPPALYSGALMSYYDYNDYPKIFDLKLGCTFAAPMTYCPGASHPALAGTDWAEEDYNTYFYTALDDVTPTQAHVERMLKRKYITFEELMQQKTNYYNRVLTPGAEKLTYVTPHEVPYKFCTDEYSSSGNVGCQPFDKGANYTELVQDRIEGYEKFYFFTHFRRDRAKFSASSPMRMFQSLRYNTFGPMVDIYRYYLYGASSIGQDSSGNVLRLNDFPLGRDWQQASIDGLNFLASVLMQPDAGRYCSEGGVYKIWRGTDAEFETDCPNADKLDVPIGVGRYFNTQWTNDYDYKPTVIGMFWDKLAALYAVTSSEGDFYRNFSNLLDEGAFSLSYWRGLDTEMLDLFADFFLGDTYRFAWRFNGSTDEDGNAILAPVPVVDAYLQCLEAQGGSMYGHPEQCVGVDGEDVPGNPVEPSSSWTLRYYAVLLPMLQFNSYYDYRPDFSKYARVCLKDSADCMTYTNLPGAPTPVTYTDPLTGYQYVAPNVLAYDPNDYLMHADRALGQLLLRKAQNEATGYDVAATRWSEAERLVTAGTDFPLQADEQAALGLSAAHTSGLSPEDKVRVVNYRYGELQEISEKVAESSSFLNVVREFSAMTGLN